MQIHPSYVLCTFIQEVGEVCEAIASGLPALGNEHVCSPVLKPRSLLVSRGSKFLGSSCLNFSESMIGWI
jgi:hypothetical protein